MRLSWLRGISLALACTTVSARAAAYTIQSVASEGCHERITSEALRRVRVDVPEAAAIEPSADERALIDDLQFDPDDDMRDLAAVTLLIGVRDNDLKGRGADDLTELAQVHGNPARQEEHCLRARSQDEPSGSQTAVGACRSYIEQKVEEALDGLDDQGAVRPDFRVELAVHLAIRGDVDAPLPAFYVHMGQALHALEDSFSHTYRTADGRRVTVALNWLELIEETLEEERDGPPHSNDLDACDDADELRTLRRQLATDAAESLLRAVLGPGKTRDERMAAARAVLDQYLSHEAGCTSANGWCAAPESGYDKSACACEAAGSPNRSSLAGPFAIAIATALVARRRRRTRRASLIGVGLASVAVAGPALAQPAEPPPDVVPDPGPANPDALAWGGAATISGAFDNPGFAGALGARLRVHRNWAVGLDAEWNPFISVTGGEPIRTGVFNIYGRVFARFPLAYEPINLRSSGALGTSILLTDLYGAPAGSAGIFLGADFLGVEYKASRVVCLVFNPLGIAVPIPQLSGVPFLYPQYRISFSVELYGT